MARYIPLYNEKTDTYVMAYEGFSWSGLFLGPITAALRKDFLNFFVVYTSSALISMCIFEISSVPTIDMFQIRMWLILFAISLNVLIALKYNKIHLNQLLKKGYRVLDNKNFNTGSQAGDN